MSDMNFSTEDATKEALTIRNNFSLKTEYQMRCSVILSYLKEYIHRNITNQTRKDLLQHCTSIVEEQVDKDRIAAAKAPQLLAICDAYIVRCSSMTKEEQRFCYFMSQLQEYDELPIGLSTLAKDKPETESQDTSRNAHETKVARALFWLYFVELNLPVE
jgi:hypothetical protein